MTNDQIRALQSHHTARGIIEFGPKAGRFESFDVIGFARAIIAAALAEQGTAPRDAGAVKLFIIRQILPNGTVKFYSTDDLARQLLNDQFIHAEASILTEDEADEVLARYPSAEHVKVA